MKGYKNTTNNCFKFGTLTYNFHCTKLKLDK